MPGKILGGFGSETDTFSEIARGKQAEITMKQPSLGNKIAELRKAKGLTQEELVQRCNLNVRTLQRIEAGEVQPRPHTVKTLFEALEHPWEAIAASPPPPPLHPPYFYLSLAAGIVYFFLVYFEISMELEWMETGEMAISYPLALVKLFTWLTYTGFLLGWLVLEKQFPNAVLRISLWVMLGSNLTWYSLDFFAIFSQDLRMESYYLVKIMTFGFAYAFLGAGYLVQTSPWENLSKVVGALGLVAGVLIFSGIGVILGLIPLTLFELGQLALLVWAVKGSQIYPHSPSAAAP
jgi:transcriptional regulator with XRE-family HTH domain